MRPTRILLLHAQAAENETLSYQHGWPAQFVRHPRFDVVPLNVLGSGLGARLRDARRAWRPPADAVVVLHSIFSNGSLLPPRLIRALARSRVPKAFFIGNEYKLMPEKMEFAETLGVDLLVSQIFSPRVHDLYRERLGCAVVAIPNAGFDPGTFAPLTPRRDRVIDVGYRAFDGPWYLGHRDRVAVAEATVEAANRRGLRVDISLDPAARFTEAGWASFLDRCRGQIGCEAGTDFFELTDMTRLAVNAYLLEHPEASFEDVRERFFDGRRDRVSGRTLSGRNVEAAATKTVQILIEGDYGGLLSPGEHYIPLRRDLGDVDDALARLRDDSEAGRIADAAFELAMEKFTYAKLIDRFHDALGPFL